MLGEINHTRACVCGELGFRGRLRCFLPRRAKSISVPTGKRIDK
jgi:hypothetical protein